MTTLEPQRRPHRHVDQLLPPSQLPIPGSTPASGWSTLPMADRLIQALERLINLNEQTARITALYRANLEQQQQTAARRSADARHTRDGHRDRDAPHDGLTPV